MIRAGASSRRGTCRTSGRSVTMSPWLPLFEAGEQGGVWDPSDLVELGV